MRETTRRSVAVRVGFGVFALAQEVDFTLLRIAVIAFACGSLAELSLAATVVLEGGGATYTWNDNVEFQSESHLITNVPSTFGGVNVAGIIGATRFYANGITGQGTISSNIEAGHVWSGHESLSHVTGLTNHTSAPDAGYGTPAYDRHATWVGMMIGGRNGGSVQGNWQTGIAPSTDLRSGAIATSWVAPAYALSFSATGTSLDFPYSSAPSGFGTADVINSSWGSTGSGPGSLERQGRDIRSMITDSLANGNRFTTFVASAGNSGSGTNTVGAPGAGYNNITVGALQNDGLNNYNSVASFSSRGPQDYGDPINGLISAATAQRAAVDIAAPGTNLTSAFYGGQTGGNDASLSGSTNSPGANLYSGGVAGTSFAAPITAAGVALMDSAAIGNGLPVDARDARVVKANLLNAASKIPGWNNGQTAHTNGNGGVRTTQALDFASGAGALDLDRTYDQYLLGQTDIVGLVGGTTDEVVGWDYAEVILGSSTDILITTPLEANTEFRSTLAWFRERTYTSSFTQSDVGFADLNLEIWDATFTTLFSESLSQYTPVEHLSFLLPVTGLYGIRVSYPQNVFGALTSEQFGLAWWGVAAVPEPSTIAMLISASIVGLMAYRRRGLKREG